MKRNYKILIKGLLLSGALLLSGMIWADQTINVATAGTLSTLGLDLQSNNNVTITGTMNSADFSTLAGQLSNFKRDGLKIDLSAVTVVDDSNNPVTTLFDNVFDGATGGGNDYYATKLIIPNSITKLGYKSFAGCSVDIVGNGVTELASYCLSWTRGFVTVRLDQMFPNLQIVSRDALNYMDTQTTKFVFGSKVTYFQPYCMWGDDLCSEIEILATTPPVIQYYSGLSDAAFIKNGSGITKMKLTVPSGTLAAYQAAPFYTDFFDPIVEKVVTGVDAHTAIGFSARIVSDVLYMQGLEEGSVVNVSDVSGRTVLHFTASKSEFSSSVNWKNGIYLISVQNQSGRSSLKIVK